MTDLAKALEVAQELKRREGMRRLLRYTPYEFQRKFHAAEATNSQIVIIAGNRVGKCITISTIVDTEDGPRSVRELLGCGRFRVWSWNGSKKVLAEALPVFKKAGLHRCYRVVMSDGRWFEAADDHRILTNSGWRFISDLYRPSWLSLLASSLGLGQSVHVSGAPRWSRTPSGFLGRYSRGFRRCGERLLWGVGNAVTSLPLPAGVLPHSVALSHTGGLGNTRTSTRQPSCDHLSSRYGEGHCAVRSVGSQVRNACTSVRWWKCVSRIAWRLLPASISRLLSTGVVQLHVRGIRRAWDLLEIEGNNIVSCNFIGLQEVYDFSVPEFENYTAAGVVHHNTRAGGAGTAFHLTGLYPDWWEGRRFTRPVRWWAAGVTNPKTRDVCQRELCGNPEDPSALGTGMIPGEKILETTRFPGVPNAYSSVAVRHVSGGVSVLGFKSYEMGNQGFMSESLDGIWLDEEPPMDIYTQSLTRVLDRAGLLYLTFTPESGATELYAQFRQKLKPGQAVINATWDDAPHLDAKTQAQILEAYPPHEREMRRRGIAQLGSGLVWPIEEDRITWDPVPLPSYFRWIGAIDFGYDHPTAVVWCALDPETNCFYVVDAYKESGAIIPVHASAMKARGHSFVPMAWPHDGQKHDSGSGEGLASQYRNEGVKMLPSWFTNPPGVEGEGSIAVEPGIQAILTAMEQGRFKVARHLTSWFEEWRMYHRKDGLIVKVNDDLMSATRYAFQSRRFSKTREAPPRVAPVPMESPYQEFL